MARPFSQLLDEGVAVRIQQNSPSEYFHSKARRDRWFQAFKDGFREENEWLKARSQSTILDSGHLRSKTMMKLVFNAQGAQAEKYVRVCFFACLGEGDDPDACGFATVDVDRDPEGVCVLSMLLVDPLVQGRGVGSAMLEHITGILASRTLFMRYCQCRDSAAFYAKHGFLTVKGDEFYAAMCRVPQDDAKLGEDAKRVEVVKEPLDVVIMEINPETYFDVEGRREKWWKDHQDGFCETLDWMERRGKKTSRSMARGLDRMLHSVFFGPNDTTFHRRCYFAFVAGENMCAGPAVGYAVVDMHPTEDQASQLRTLLVEPACQRRGVGRALVTQVMGDLAKRTVVLRYAYVYDLSMFFEGFGFRWAATEELTVVMQRSAALTLPVGDMAKPVSGTGETSASAAEEDASPAKSTAQAARTSAGSLDLLDLDTTPSTAGQQAVSTMDSQVADGLAVPDLPLQAPDPFQRPEGLLVAFQSLARSPDDSEDGSAAASPSAEPSSEGVLQAKVSFEEPGADNLLAAEERGGAQRKLEHRDPTPFSRASSEAGLLPEALLRPKVAFEEPEGDRGHQQEVGPEADNLLAADERREALRKIEDRDPTPFSRTSSEAGLSPAELLVPKVAFEELEGGEAPEDFPHSESRRKIDARDRTPYSRGTSEAELSFYGDDASNASDKDSQDREAADVLKPVDEQDLEEAGLVAPASHDPEAPPEEGQEETALAEEAPRGFWATVISLARCGL